MVGSTLYCFGGASDVPPGTRMNTGEFSPASPFVALEIAAVPHVPLTAAALKEVGFNPRLFLMFVRRYVSANSVLHVVSGLILYGWHYPLGVAPQVRAAEHGPS